MDFGFSEEQESLQRNALEFLKNECPNTVVRAAERSDLGYDPDLWRKVADLGWLGLGLPEAHGGLGSFLDLVIVGEEMGRALFPGPFIPTVVVAGHTLSQVGTAAQQAEFLPGIINGEQIWSIALTEAQGRWNAKDITLAATRQGDGYVLNGEKWFVPYAHAADYLLCVARSGQGATPEDGITVFIVDAKQPGVRQTPLQVTYGRQSVVQFDGVRVGSDRVLGQPGAGWDVVRAMLQKAAVAECAQMVGAAQQALELTVEYAKARVAFGHVIGAYQAVAHRCANMAVDVDTARVGTYTAAWLLSDGQPCDREVAAAKAWTSDAFARVVANGHQVHGGIGFTEEYPLQLYTRYSRMAEVLWGSADFHRERVAQLLGSV